MQQSFLRVRITFTLICFSIALTSTSCMSSKTSPYSDDELAWQEPIWEQTGTEDVKLQWKFGPGDEVHYNETQKATITSEGKTTEREYAVTLQYYVKKVSKEGTAQVIVSGKNLDTKGTDSELTRFLFHSSPNLGSFSMSPSKRMSNVNGLISIRSLPTFPND